MKPGAFALIPAAMTVPELAAELDAGMTITTLLLESVATAGSVIKAPPMNFSKSSLPLWALRKSIFPSCRGTITRSDVVVTPPLYPMFGIKSAPGDLASCRVQGKNRGVVRLA